MIKALVILVYFMAYQARPAVLLSPGGLATKAAQLRLEVALLTLIFSARPRAAAGGPLPVRLGVSLSINQGGPDSARAPVAVQWIVERSRIRAPETVSRRGRTPHAEQSPADVRIGDQKRRTP
jgi:hypothetical protein